MDALIADIVFDPATGNYKPGNSGFEELEATLIPFSPCPDPRRIRDISTAHPTRLKIYPDSGATIFLGGHTHLRHMGLGGFSLAYQGWLPVTFEIGSRTTKQALYICNKIQVIYFSKEACIDVGILPPCFLKTMTSPPSVTCDPIHPAHKTDKPIFENPKTPPYPPTSKNIQNLKQWQWDQFATRVFDKSGKFPAMSGPPVHNHLKDGAISKAKHNPIPVPYHYREEVEKVLWDDVERGSPTDWCSTMVITAKKNGKPRRTMDYQYLSSQRKRETRHTSSHSNCHFRYRQTQKKTILDVIDGYHSIPLDEESQPLITFIAEWDRFMYLRMPQGYLASGNAYTRRYDEMIKNFPRKIKIVDDTQSAGMHLLKAKELQSPGHLRSAEYSSWAAHR